MSLPAEPAACRRRPFVVPGCDYVGVVERLLTPSKITAWLDCAHYLTLRARADTGELEPTNEGLGSFARLLMDKGLVHERSYLDGVVRDGRSVFEVPAKAKGEFFAQWASRVGGVLEAGHQAVSQLPMVQDGLRGVADFLIRVDAPSRLGEFSYEPVDAKLARLEAKPGHVLQLCFYADALEAAQGLRPERAHLYLGSGVTESIRLRDVDAYWRRIRHQLRQLLEEEPQTGTYPNPCAHCSFCEFAEHCASVWRADDALHLVAGIRADDIASLKAAGMSTMAALAGSVGAVDGVRPERLGVIRHQALLQRAAVEGEPPPVGPVGPPDIGDAVAVRRTQLPAPDAADVFVDYEGHPFWTPARGLFFLFGLLYRDPASGSWVYDPWWAHSEVEEAEQTHALIRWIADRRAAHPGMHLYHYNHTERSALERLARDHGADEQLLAGLVSRGVFVDVLDVVRRTVRVGAESYSLKVLERVAGYERGHDIDQGAGAVVEYEAYCQDHEPDRLERIAAYNADDVRATLAVRDWLLGGPLADHPHRPEVEPGVEDAENVDDLVAGLLATGEDWKALLARLLEYWSREGRAHRAQHLALLDGDLSEQLANPDVIAALEFAGVRPRTGRQTLDRAVFRFPPQELSDSITGGRKCTLMYPVGADAVLSVSADLVDGEAGELVVAWGEQAQAAPLPSALVLNDWIGPRPKPEALAEYAQRVLDGSTASSDAARHALLERHLPRFVPGEGPTGGTFVADIERIVDVAPHLDGSYLAVQGPPGTGKTYTGAHIVDRLVDQRLRVGVTAFSHAAINNLVRAAVKQRPTLHVLRQGSAPSDPAQSLPNTTYNANRKKWDSGDFDLVAGTAWLFANATMASPPALDVLIVDEAGQMGLADALAALSSTRNVILLGDPLQLSQVSLAAHPEGAGASTLEHVLGNAATLPTDRGVFLDVTWRMHRNVCDFLSQQIYDGRLSAHASCNRQSVGGTAGLRWVRAVHEGCDTSSEVEAHLVADTVRSLLGQTWIGVDGDQRPLTAADVMVVAPYNDHVDLVRATLDAQPALSAARVGTVDRFQGQEAPVVIFTMATSTGADMPRTADFLYSRNRLNVAISRARALAYVICTEDLLDTRARTVDEMRLIGTLCSFVEHCQ